jgi:phosphohistidine phosphatase
MSIFLSQHGTSAPKNIDAQRGLTPDGAADVTRVAETLAASGIVVDVIWHSGKTRAAQTAALFAASMNPAEGVKRRGGLDPNDDVVALAESLPKNRNELYVGHLPFMERLLSYMITGNPDSRILRFKNGGVVRLDWDDEGNTWIIGWTVFAHL